MLRVVLLLFSGLAAAVAGDLTGDWQRAVQDNRLEFIRRHLDDMADVDLAGERGKTALMAAASRGAAELVRDLLQAGAEVNARNRTGGSALMYAAWSGDMETARILLAHGAEVNHRSGNGWTALMMAAAKGHGPLAKILLQHGADANLPDVYGWTPLMRAAYGGRMEVVKVLLDWSGTELERLNDHGQTALHLAVIQGEVAIARALLAHGARPDVEDFAGRTPRSITRMLGHRDLSALLAEKAKGEMP